MNWKKNLLLTLLMGIILTGTFLTTPASQAAVASQGKHLKMETPTYRDSGYAYKLGLESDSETTELEMWKIYEYNDNDQTRKNDNSTIYCLRMGVGFGSENGSPTEPRIYQKYADMKNPQNGDQDIINQYKSSVLGNSQERYNSLMWVLDHCYVPAPSTASEEAKKNAEAYKKELLNAAGIPENSTINDDIIDIVQQVAIWYFTNTDKYKAQDITTIYVKKKDEVGDYKNLEDVFDWDLQDEVKTLYQYFIGEGEKNKNTAPSTTDATNPIQLNSTDAKVTLRKDTDGSEYYLAGPYKIEKQLEKEFTISASLNNESTFTLLNEDKQTGTDIQTLAGNGQSFYVKIPKNENTNNIENVSLTITTKVKQNTITYWEVNDNNAANEQPVVEIKPEEKVFTQEVTFKLSNFDLALRKFVTNINGKELKKDETTYTRGPVIDLDPLTKASATTANYNHLKSPQGVAVGDIVIYTIRIYNEGELDGYASAITDYLPPQLEFVTDDEEHFNANYGWVLDPLDPSERTVTTNLLAKREDDNIYAEENEENMLKAFNGNSLDYKELKIKCKVVTTEILDRIITNIAEITEFTDADGKEIIDRDSQKQNANIPNETELPDYKGHNNNKSVLSDASYFYQGQQDDDDFEKLILEEFDLALRKFITKVNDTPVTSRIPKFTNVKDSNGNYIYEHSKEPIEVETTDVVEYTIRIYNEGDIAGYAKEITDNIPEGLEFLPQNEINQEYRWIMLDENGEKTEDVSKAVKITTDYLSKAQEQEEGKNLIAPFDSTKTSPDYKDVKVVFKVVAPSTYTGIITNIAEISDDSNETGNEVEDRDSIPDNNNEKEDDIDINLY